MHHKILFTRTDRSAQTVQAQIRLQSDQGLHCLPFYQHLVDTLLHCNIHARSCELKSVRLGKSLSEI